MAHVPWRLLLLCSSALVSACLDTRPYGPTGYLCESDVHCPAGTYCLRRHCELKSEVPVKPTLQNTGVPAGTTLTLSGALQITENGRVVEGLDIQGCVSIKANNVTLRRSRVRCDSYFGVVLEDGFQNVLLEDLEVDGMGNAEGRAVVLHSGTARRLQISNVGAGVDLGSNARLEASFIHALVGTKPSGTSSNGGTDVTVFGNTSDLSPSKVGAAIDLHSGLSRLRRVQIEHNWVNGGQYLFNVGGGAQGAESVLITRNRLGRDFAQGPFSLATGVLQTENVYEDTGDPVSP